jgi:hypothetical protein
LGRAYGQVCRRRLREHLLGKCAAAGVRYAPGLVDTLVHGDVDKDEPSLVTGTFTAGANTRPLSAQLELSLCPT